MMEVISKKINMVNLPPCPNIMIKVLSILNKEDFDFSEIAGLIRLDPSITASCMSLVNSAYYGLANKIDSVDKALIVIGKQNVMKIVLMISVQRLKFGEKRSISKDLWKHSVQCAISSEVIVPILRKRKVINYNYSMDNVVFTACLLHDIGKMFLDLVVDDANIKIDKI